MRVGLCLTQIVWIAVRLTDRLLGVTCYAVHCIDALCVVDAGAEERLLALQRGRRGGGAGQRR